MIGFNSNGAATPTANGASSERRDRRRQSRYRAQCPNCKKRIEAGHWVVPVDPTRKRPRWKHEDCDNVPTVAAAAGAGVDESAREQLAELEQKLAYMAKKLHDVLEAAPRKIVVSTPDRPDVEIEGHVHPVFDELLELAAARESIFLPGPSGCGKSHIAGQVAKALGLKFGAISCSAGMSEAQLLGRMVPHGDQGQFEFLGTQFLDCYENGGIFLFDEIDAADSNVLLVINSALANGHLSVPARPEKPVAERHPDFVFIAAANTFGTGADRQYVGRNQLDAATLDRFRIGTVEMDYDRALERQLFDAVCDDSDLLTTLWHYRDRIAAARLERVLSTRFILQAAAARARGRDLTYIESKLFAGWRADEVAKVKAG